MPAKMILTSIRTTFVLAVLTGIAFPFVITGIAQLAFKDAANGSLLMRDGKVIGSKLIGQPFSKPEYFHTRPSAAGSGYAGEASGGTNLGPTSSKLILGQKDDPQTKADESFAGVRQLAEQYRNENNLAPEELVPVDAVTRSGSGLDPDISPLNAKLQTARVAKARNLPDKAVADLVQQNTHRPTLGILGETRVNVVTLNLALDALNTPPR